MDHRENHKNHSSLHAENFLLDEEFIRWRLFPTEELDQYWTDLLTRQPHLEQSLHEAIRQFKAVEINRHQLPDKDKREVFEALLLDIRRHKRGSMIRRISTVAAFFVIALLSLLYVNRKQHTDKAGLPADEVIVGEALPEKEIYLITGGEKINIAHQSHISLTGKGRALVTDSTEKGTELLLATTAINRLVVPYGKRTNLTLSDGTEVWLNSGTELNFPSTFTGERREITVDGEIYIDVAHDAHIPFIVHTRDMEIYVHGTSFNLSSYNDDQRKTIVLVEGKVKIETAGSPAAELLPNEKYEIINHEITKESVDVSEYISWTKGILEFNETPVSEMLKRIGRYYNVQFDISSETVLSEKSCSGKLFLSNNLDSVMTSVSVLSSTLYERDGNTIHITKK